MNSQLYHAAERIAQERLGELAWRERLYHWATSPPNASVLARRWRMGLVAISALLVGLGLIFWLAANWPHWSRGAKFALIQISLVGLIALACVLPRWRTASLLGAVLALGGLLAFIGQTYQTGADAWQLFAAWAVLSLLWVLKARSDLLWALWVAIAAAALALWTGPLGIFEWISAEGRPMGVVALTLLAWLVVAVVPMGVARVPFLRLNGGLGLWSHRLALALALSAWVGVGLSEVFQTEQRVSLAWVMAAALISGVFWVSLRTRWKDLPALALSLLAINVLVMGLAARLILTNDFSTEGLLLLGVLGLACLGASASWLFKQQKAWPQGEPS